MTYKFNKVVKVTIKFKDSEESLFDSYRQWLDENEIYPAVRGGGRMRNGSTFLYSEENAERIREWMRKNGCTYSHFLKS